MFPVIETLKDLDIAKVAAAIEADAGEKLPGLRESLAEAKAGTFAEIHKPEQIAARKRGRPVGSVKAKTKIAATLRFDPDVLAGLKATGPGWQTRVNDTMRAALKRGKLTAA